MIVYHGTSEAAALDIAKRGVRIEASSKGYFGMGFYTTENKTLAKSNYADFADDDEGAGVVLEFKVSPRARLLDLRKPKHWEKWASLTYRGRKVTEYLSFDNFHEVMQAVGVDGLYDESFEGWVFYTPKVLRPAHVMTNPQRRRNPSQHRKTDHIMDPLEDLSWLERPLYHGTRDLRGLLKDGFRREPAITLNHPPEYAWSGMRSGSFCSGGGVNWKPFVWSWWKDVPKEGKERLRALVGPIKSGDDLGQVVSLIWTDRRESEAVNYMGWDDRVAPPLALDWRKIPDLLGAFEPDVSSKSETVLVVLAGDPFPVKPTLLRPAHVR